MFRRPVITPIIWVLMLAGFIGGGLFYGLERKLFPTVLAFAEPKVVQTAVEAVNGAVRSEVLSRRLRYEDLVTIHKDDEGRIVLVQADTVKVNDMAASVAVAVEKGLRELQQEEFEVPLGQILGSQFLANCGPRVKVQIIPVGSVKVVMLDKFESAGINQTRHRFSLHLDTSVRIAVPLHNKEARITTDVPLVENIIVGTVPSTFVSIPGGLTFTPPKP
ncbi:MAG: sporulation protein YunB [Bacillota bacterium]